MSFCIVFELSTIIKVFTNRLFSKMFLHCSVRFVNQEPMTSCTGKLLSNPLLSGIPVHSAQLLTNLSAIFNGCSVGCF